jgi:hypothetical protein
LRPAGCATQAQVHQLEPALGHPRGDLPFKLGAVHDKTPEKKKMWG